jgi:hypothetical protein
MLLHDYDPYHVPFVTGNAQWNAPSIIAEQKTWELDKCLRITIAHYREWLGHRLRSPHDQPDWGKFITPVEGSLLLVCVALCCRRGTTSTGARRSVKLRVYDIRIRN